jgi:hypothetical protein
VVISKRERYIAIGAVSAIALLALNSFALSPYLQKRDDIATELAGVNKKLDESDELFRRQRILRPVWSNIEQAGLQTDSSDAGIQVDQAIDQWVRNSNLLLANFRPDARPTQQGQFQVLSFHISVNGPLNAISHLLWSAETAAIPLRVTDLQISPRHEGTDDLTVQLTVSTISIVPQSAKPAVNPGSNTASNSGRSS